MIAVCYGTRAEAIKLGPVAAELRAFRVPFLVLCSGQHTDLLRGTPAETDLCDGVSFALSSDELPVFRRVRQAEERFRTALQAHAITVVVVQGDTMSALAAARAAKGLGLLLCHVEAGVRSHNAREPWPEEEMRVEIDRIADWHYAPTSTAYANLVTEGLTHIKLTGNTVVSALTRYSDARPTRPLDHCLVTLHRREWRMGKTVYEVLDALSEAAEEHPAARFVWPIHPATRVLAARWLEHLPVNIHVTQPLGYRDATQLLSGAFGVLTDSGGLQEEAATLGVPCAVLRRVTDRPESVEQGVAVRFDPTRAGVLAATQVLCAGGLPRRPSDVFGDATAASQVARHLASLC